MECGLDWLFQPVLEGMCSYESLKNGTLSLFDIALMNDALNVKYENEARMSEEAERKRAI